MGGREGGREGEERSESVERVSESKREETPAAALRRPCCSTLGESERARERSEQRERVREE